MQTKTEAIVLHSFKYGESKLIVDMFTRQCGRLSFVVLLPHSGKGRLKKQFFQPLSLLELSFDHRPKVQLQKPGDVQIAFPFVSIPFHQAKLAIALFLSEFLYHALKGEQQNIPLYDYIRNSIEWLDARGDHVANFHLVFLLHLSRFLGFFPNLDDYHPGCCFDLRAGEFSAVVPVHRDFIAPEEAAKMELLMRMDFPTMHLFRMTRRDRQRLLELALAYYRLHLPDFPELKSLNILQELYE